MNGIIAWFADNRVAANFLMLIILVSGLAALPLIKKEILPPIAWDVISVTIAYPGASPSEIEEAVISRVEEVVRGLDGLANIYSVAQESVGIISIELDLTGGGSLEKAQAEVESRVQSIVGFPESTKKPVIKQLSAKDLVGNVVIHGDGNDRTLKSISEAVRRDLLNTGLISVVTPLNSKEYEVVIEIDENKMQRYGIVFPEVADAIKRQSKSLASGEIDSNEGKTSILTTTDLKNKEDIEDILVRSSNDGARVRIRDIAKVVDGFAEKGDRLGEFNGDPALYLSVYRTGNQSILTVAEAMKQYVEQPKTFIPEGIHLAIWQDTSRYFASRIDLLLKNGASGLCILFLILMLFLSFRLSFWVGIGIPVAFLGAFWVLMQMGGSINMISLFAFILVLGIVVDDAIIVGENIYTHQKNGKPGLEGAILGAQEVSKPVIFAILTTIVMFFPMLFLPGVEGKLVYSIPVVVIAILIFSLVESLLILPAHLANSQVHMESQSLKTQKKNRITGAIHNFNQKFSDGFEGWIKNQFGKFLVFCLKWRYACQALFIGLFLIYLGLLQGGWLKMVLFSTIEADNSVAAVTFPVGTPMSETMKAVKKLENAALQIKEKFNDSDENNLIENIVTLYGQAGGQQGSHLGSVIIEMRPSEDRKLSGENLNRLWRELTGDLLGALELEFNSTLNKPGPGIDLKLTSSNLDHLRQAAQELKQYLAKYDGIYDIRDGYQEGKQEIYIEPKESATELGIKLDEIAAQVRQAFYGVQVMNIQRGEEEVGVSVRYPAEFRNSLWSLENFQINLPSGSLVPLASLADIRYAVGPSIIHRTNSRRSIRVKAFVDEDIISSQQVMANLKSSFLSKLDSKYPDLGWLPSGVQKTKNNFFKRLSYAYLICLIIMYAMMATLFKSYWQPLIIMYAIPFGVLGALTGHWLLGLEVTLWSVIGMCAVSGVVVNDNLVLVDYMNRYLKREKDLVKAIQEAGIARFRPIFLTTLTTFCGLVPLMLETSVQAKFLIPMAVSLAFGVLFATLVTLILVPATYYIMHDVRGLFKRPLSHASLSAKS